MFHRLDPNNLKISAKGFIIVFVPLLVTLCAMALAVVLLYQWYQLADSANRSRNIQAHANHLQELYFDATHTLVAYHLTRSRLFVAQYEESVRAVMPTLQELDKEARDETELRIVKNLQTTGARNLALLADTFRVIEENDRSEPSLVANSKLDQELEVSINQTTVAQVKELTNHEAELQKRYPYDEAKNRRSLAVVIILGIVGNVVFALLAALAFTKNITRRLQLVTQNAIMLSAGKPLNPLVSGADEISTLDRVFHQTADALRLAQRKETAIISNALDVICSIDAQGTFVTVSPSAQAIWGYAPDELVGMKLANLLPDSEKEITRSMFESLDTSNASARFDGRICCKNGHVADMHWSVQKSEEERSYFCIVQDISSRKEVERMKNDFIAMVSHDIRSPLTATRGFLEMLIDGVYGEVPDKAIVRARSAESSLGRLLALVNNILDLEKMESGRLNLEFSFISLNQIVEETVDSLQGFAEQQDVNLEFSADEEIEVEVDPHRLMQVVLNLVSNAIKFSPIGGRVSVAVTLNENGNGSEAGQEASQDGDTEYGAKPYAEVSVSDEGRGVPAEFKEKIFDRFQQVHDEDSRNQGGAGLGLSICKRIIELHGGAIGVDDAKIGSVFWFRIPLRQTSERED